MERFPKAGSAAAALGQRFSKRRTTHSRMADLDLSRSSRPMSWTSMVTGPAKRKVACALPRTCVRARARWTYLWRFVNVNSCAAPRRRLENARRTRQKREAAPHEAVEYRGPRWWDGEHDFWVVDLLTRHPPPH